MKQITIQIDSIGGMCPTQADGTINGKPFYFRARHGTWTLAIAETEDEAVEAAMKMSGGLYFAAGADDTHGAMGLCAVGGIIGQAALDWWQDEREKEKENISSPR